MFMAKLPYYVEINMGKCKCRTCSKEIKPDEMEILQMRGRVRGVCKECADKIESFIEGLESED